MLLLTAFQVICTLSVFFGTGNRNYNLLCCFLVYMLAEWLYMLIGSVATGSDYFELEVMAFFLSGIGLTVCASISEEYALKQLIAIGLGLAVYLVLLIILRNIDFAMKLRVPAAIGSVLLLGANLALAKTVNGTLNWIDLGFFSVQPSELIKVMFILVGAVTLEKLISNMSIAKYVAFSLVCIGGLFLMQDFGTALIFFFTFILISYMRSGNWRTLLLICTAALLGAALIIYFKPYVASRFAAYRHVWDYIDDAGYQQTRTLIYMASGGLFGLGIGQGYLRNVYAASTDLVFGVVCEEMGFITGLGVVACFVVLVMFALRSTSQSGSSFYAIAATAAAGMMLFQLALNVFGITDILPLTGVTLPFVSRGGSSMICSWGLLAYIKAAGITFNAPAPLRAIPVSRKTRTEQAAQTRRPQNPEGTVVTRPPNPKGNPKAAEKSAPKPPVRKKRAKK